jgi:hypothetical protein
MFHCVSTARSVVLSKTQGDLHFTVHKVSMLRMSRVTLHYLKRRRVRHKNINLSCVYVIILLRIPLIHEQYIRAT